MRPETAVMLITADGLSEAVMDEMLDAGELPQIARLIEHGVRVPFAIDSLPSLTYPNLTTILTGCDPRRHGVLGNKWFDRTTLTYRDYGTMQTYRDADGDIGVPTVYEQLGDEFTVSIQCAVKRGVTRTIDNWATSGIRWFFGGFEATDQLIPWRFDIIAEEANRRGRWPVLIHAYFPGIDEVGHQKGSDSARYRTALRNLDGQIGLIETAVAEAGMAQRTCTILVADHNHTPVPPGRWFDVARWVRRTAHLRVQTAADGGRRPQSKVEKSKSQKVEMGNLGVACSSGDVGEPREARPIAAELPLTPNERACAAADAVVVAGGDRFAAVHLKGPGGWSERPTSAQIEAVLGSGPNRLVDHEAIELVAIPAETAEGERAVDLYSRRGRSRVERRRTGGGNLYRYTSAAPGALAFDGASGAAVESDAWRDAAAWLDLTAGSAYPGVVPGLADLFDSPRAGDLVLFAAPGWDFAPGSRGGHGGIGAIDTRVPMVFSGAMIDHSAVLPAARLADVTPTILGLLGKSSGAPAERFDGVDRSSGLRGATQKGGED